MPYNSITDRTDAGALMPEDAADSIIQALPTASMALQYFRQVRMSRAQQRMPVLAALPSAYFVNGDTGLKQTSEQSWTNKYLNAEELAVIVPVPEAVLDDSAFDIWAEVKPRLVEAIGALIDGAILFGTNKPASWPTDIVAGARAASNSIVNGTSAIDVADDINNLMGLVEADGFDVNGFIARRQMKATFRGLRSTQKEPIFQPSLVAGTPATLYGEKIDYSLNGSWDVTNDVIAGDWTQGIIGLRQDLTYKMLDQAVITDNTGAILFNLAQQDMVALRVVMRIAYQVANPLTKLNTNSSTRFPFAVLRAVGQAA